jgi:transcriptional regulator with XRE-family HTH domain
MDLPSRKTSERARIAGVVRALRKERGWTQAELAEKLGLSQNRLSEIERGDGSFTAEQFLLILKIFNVTTARFADTPDRAQQLQNALARLGASHLQESAAVIPAEGLADVVTAIRETLLLADPRLTTALAPVLCANVDRVSLSKLYLDLGSVGLERRLAWLCENTLAALDSDILRELPRTWAQRVRRAIVVLGAFLDPLEHRLESQTIGSSSPDVFDPSIRSKQTLDSVQATASSISRKWGIVSALQPRDFAQAIRAASAANP